MKLTQLDKNKLWGEDGPYSEAQLIFETRILDDRISRIFLMIEVHINPFTFELIKKHRDEFLHDPMIQQLLDHAEYRGLPDGYVSCAYQEEYKGGKQLEEANERLELCEKTIIKMHQYVLSRLNKRTVH